MKGEEGFEGVELWVEREVFFVEREKWGREGEFTSRVSRFSKA